MNKSRDLIIALGLLIFISAGFVLAVNNNENNGVPSLLSEIKEVLQNILEKLNIIAEKETNVEVTVEPNITVNPPQIIVNPNITIPDNPTIQPIL